jgi:hypothetical protein
MQRPPALRSRRKSQNLPVTLKVLARLLLAGRASRATATVDTARKKPKLPAFEARAQTRRFAGERRAMRGRLRMTEANP